jgi:hypothetical protein
VWRPARILLLNVQSEKSMAAIVITGASTGIGRDFAHQCAADGFDVILVARSQSQLESVAGDVRQNTGRTAVVISQDLAKPGAAQDVFDAVRRSGLPVEALINNAGFGLLGRFWELDAQQQVDMLELNVVALTHLTRLFLPGFIERRRGRILNVASTAAFQPGPLMSVYYASKAYVVSFSAALHNEVREFGVTVTTLCPGATRTEFQNRAGLSASRLFNTGFVMDSPTVARIGLRAMKAGKPMIIPGRINALMAFLTRFAPLQLTASMARRFQETH